MSGAPLIFDHTALVALFASEPDVYQLVEHAAAGTVQIGFPTTAIADAEAHVQAGIRGWDALFLTPNVQSLALTEHAAIEVGGQLGHLSTRHVVHEAQAAAGIVVTTCPAMYRDQPVTVMRI